MVIVLLLLYCNRGLHHPHFLAVDTVKLWQSFPLWKVHFQSSDLRRTIDNSLAPLMYGVLVHREDHSKSLLDFLRLAVACQLHCHSEG